MALANNMGFEKLQTGSRVHKILVFGKGDPCCGIVALIWFFSIQANNHGLQTGDSQCWSLQYAITNMMSNECIILLTNSRGFHCSDSLPLQNLRHIPMWQAPNLQSRDWQMQVYSYMLHAPQLKRRRNMLLVRNITITLLLGRWHRSDHIV